MSASVVVVVGQAMGMIDFVFGPRQELVAEALVPDTAYLSGFCGFVRLLDDET